MTEQPKSECKCIDKPEQETLSYKPKATDKLALVCPKCDKTFPLFMQTEFNGHVAACSYSKPPKSSSAIKEEITPIIEPKTKGKNSEVVGQPLEQPKCKTCNGSRQTPDFKKATLTDSPFAFAQCPCPDCKPERKEGHNKLVYDKELRTIVTVDPHPEQPNTELLIVKTIQSLTMCINNELEKIYINKLSEVIYQKQAGAKARALEAINSFEKIMFELQKAFE